MQEAEQLLSECHSAEAKVRPRLQELTDSWDSLIHNCKEKKARLHEACQVRPLCLTVRVLVECSVLPWCVRACVI